MSRKTRFTLIFALLCALFMFNAFADGVSAETKVRVGIFYSSTAFKGQAAVNSETGFSIGVYDENGDFSETALENAVKNAYVYIDGGALVFASEDMKDEESNPDGAIFRAENGQKLVLRPAALSENSDNNAAADANYSADLPYIGISGKKYPELLEFVIDPNGNIKVINVVGLEQYIKGVLPNEVYTSWEPEALKAAAVATRTYTLKSMRGKHSSLGFDLCPTTDCQVYAGVTKTAKSTDSAVDGTHGQVLTYNGSLIDAVYHAISGGTTESAWGAWGGDKNAHPYLTVVSTPFEKYGELKQGHWSYVIPADTLKSIINAKYPGKLTGDIKSIDYSTDGGEYIHTMVITDTDGKQIKLTTSSAVRSLFNKYALSANFTLGRTFAPSDEQTDDTVTVITSKGKRTVDAADGLTLITADSTESFSGLSDVYFLNGKGYGHGVGMSQFGAQYAALEGYTYKQILETYYPGTLIVSKY